jgi:hypothetical protein
MPHELELEVFRAGDYGPKGRWTEDELDLIAADYDAALHEAPVTVDHAQSGPALGWVAGVRRSGDRLVARLRDLHEDFVALLRRGAFKKRSVEIYRALPETNRPYLKAVSFLGAAAPAVKGLRDVLFDESIEATSFSEELSELSGLTDSSEPSPAPEKPSLSDTEPDPTHHFSELRAELRRTGKWLPSWDASGIEDFFAALASLDEIPAGENHSINLAQWFAEFLRSLPAYLPMGEAAPAAPRSNPNSIPQGSAVSASSIDLHRRVVALRETRPDLSYSEALRACSQSASR